MAHRFEELIVWQRARRLTREVYDATRRGGFSNDASLRDQLRRASVSVMSNIAEGFERRGSRMEFARYLAMAKGSSGEVRSQLYVASDQRYLGDDESARVASLAIEVSRMLQALIASLRKPSAKQC